MKFCDPPENLHDCRSSPRPRSSGRIGTPANPENAPQNLRVALARMLGERSVLEVDLSDVPEPPQSSVLPEREVDVMLLISGGNLEEDVAKVREAHRIRPDVRILLIGTTREDGDESDFLRR